MLVKEKVLQVNELNQPIKGVSLWLDAWRRLKKNRMAIAGLVVVIAYALVAAAAQILPIYSYKKQVLEHQYLPPSLSRTAGELLYEKRQAALYEQAAKENRGELNEAEREELRKLKERVDTETFVDEKGRAVPVHQRRYILGTDSLGRDMLSRIIYGSQVSIAIGLIGTITSVLIGIILGSLAGFLGGSVDYIIMRIVDVMYGLPYMLLVIIFMAMFGRSVLNLFFALAVVSWLTVSRVMRGQIISLKNSEFVQAARTSGAGTGRIIFRHLVPNTLGVLVVYATLRIPSFIILESFLSYLGLGVQAPYASWGSLVQEGVDAMVTYPWQLFGPAITMTLFLFAMNFLGDGLRDALDPQSKNRL